MDQIPSTPIGTRRNEDIALDLMKFVAMTTGYGKAGTGATAGFQGAAATAKPDEYANALLALYARCLDTVQGKK